MEKQKRKRIRIKVGELGVLIEQREERKQRIFGELVTDIMNSQNITWEKAKEEYRKEKAIRGIAREFNLIK
jgi:hypothetical protein